MRNLCKRIAYIGVVATFLIFIGGIERASAIVLYSQDLGGGSISDQEWSSNFVVDETISAEQFYASMYVKANSWDSGNISLIIQDLTANFACTGSSYFQFDFNETVETNSSTFVRLVSHASSGSVGNSCIFNSSHNYRATIGRGNSDVATGELFMESDLSDFPRIVLSTVVYDVLDNTDTRILKLEPETGSTTPSNSVYFNYEVYLSEEDMEESGSVGMKLFLHNIDQNVVLLSAFSPSDIVLVDTYATTSGYWRYSTTTNLATGNYRLYAKIAGTWGNLFGSPLAEGCALGSNLVGITCLEANTAFTVVEDTFIGRLQQDSFGMLNDYATSSTATSTSGYAKACIPWSTSFDVVNCGSFLFIPDSYYLNSTLINFKNNVATHFPIGYVTDFVSILATTTAGSLTVIDATLPSGVAGTGAHITLDLNGVLDPILYATTSQFVNESASNTGSLYSITSYYWNIIVYVLTILYFVRRIIGAHIIPDLGNMWADSSYNPRVTFGGAVEKEYKLGKKKGLWKNRDQYMND